MEDITPMHLRCRMGHCPAVYLLDEGTLLVIGKQPSWEIEIQLRHRVGVDENIIVISPEFFSNLL